MRQRWLDPFTSEQFQFCGAYCFSLDSPYNYLLTKQGNSIVLHDELLNSLESGDIDERLLLKLLSHGLVKVNGIEHCNSVDRCVLNARTPNVYVIDITKACNLNCNYCFRNLNENTTISHQTLKDICEYIDGNVSAMGFSSISVQLWGGEPICAMDRVRFVAKYFSNKSYATRIDIETNATLITPEIARELYELNISVGVSIDGPPYIQNHQRPYADGRSSSDAARIGIENLKNNYGTNFGGICVITKRNYKQVTELIDYFYYDLGIRAIKFNLVRENPNASEKNIGLSTTEARFFAEQLIEALELYKMLGISFSEGNILTKYLNLSEGNTGNCCISQGCTGGIKILSFDMNGNVFPCEMTDYPSVKLGDIYSDKDLVHLIEGARQSNSYYRVRRKNVCASCPWWCFCRGGCSSRVIYMNQQDSVDEIECIMNQVIYPALIEKLLKNEVGTIIT